MAHPEYVLVTPAYNEERFITQTIECVLAQTILPKRWAIVSDGSTDGTDQIVIRYAASHRFIRYCRITKTRARDFGGRIHAVNVGCAELNVDSYDYIGSLDADVSFGPIYFEQLIRRFSEAPQLGLAGGVVREEHGRNLKPASGERLRAVANAAQLFRRACYEQIGGYPPLPYGGPDTYVEVAARMLGWRVETFDDLVVDHHRLTASAGGLLRGRLRQGYKDNSFGYHPLFEVFKCARRIAEPPLAIGAAARMAGYLWSHLRGERPAVREDFVRFLRKEQLQRVRAVVGLGPDVDEPSRPAFE